MNNDNASTDTTERQAQTEVHTCASKINTASCNALSNMKQNLKMKTFNNRRGNLVFIRIFNFCCCVDISARNLFPHCSKFSFDNMTLKVSTKT